MKEEQVIQNQLKELGALQFDTIKIQTKYLQGEILTLIEAAIANEKQCKAVKDVVHMAFRRKLNWFKELCGHSTNYTDDTLGLEDTVAPVGSVKG